MWYITVRGLKSCHPGKISLRPGEGGVPHQALGYEQQGRHLPPLQDHRAHSGDYWALSIEWWLSCFSWSQTFYDGFLQFLHGSSPLPPSNFSITLGQWRLQDYAAPPWLLGHPGSHPDLPEVWKSGHQGHFLLDKKLCFQDFCDKKTTVGNLVKCWCRKTEDNR